MTMTGAYFFICFTNKAIDFEFIFLEIADEKELVFTFFLLCSLAYTNVFAININIEIISNFFVNNVIWCMFFIITKLFT